MPDPTTARRPPRGARPRYRATTTITFPTDPEVRKRRLADPMSPVPSDGWSAVEIGDPVPDEIVEGSPWLVRQGHVEPIPDEAPAIDAKGGLT